MKLTEVLAGCGAEQVSGGRSSVDVTGVTQDSRRVKAGDLLRQRNPSRRRSGATRVSHVKVCERGCMSNGFYEPL